MGRLFLIVCCTLGALLLGGCGRKSEQRGPAPPAQQAQSGSGSQAGLGHFVDGADQAAIRTYLKSVREIKPRKFEVQWNPDTVPVSREEAMRSLRGISEDGRLYTFATSEPVVSKLQPGRIVWIWGITIGRISEIGIVDDATIVHTTPVSLTEAFTSADIEFASPVDFSAAYGAYRPRAAPPPAAVKSARLRTSSPMRRVVYNPPADQPDQPSPPDGGAPDNADDSDLVAATTDGYTGKIAGFEYSLGYRASQGHLAFELEARKEEEKGGRGESNEILRDQRDEFFELVKEQREARKQALEQYKKLQSLGKELADVTILESGHPVPNNPKLSQLDKDGLEALKKLDQKDQQQVLAKYHELSKEEHEDEVKAKALAAAGALAKQVFYIASDNVDIRFRGKMDLNAAGLDTVLKIASSRMTQAAVNFQDMSGRIEVEFVGRLGQAGSGAVSIPVANVPVSMNVPLPIYGVPFVYQLSADFLVKLFLSGKHAAHHFLGRYEFKGGAGVLATDSKTDTNTSLSASEPEVEDDTASSPGTSGTVLAIQLPRIGLGVGLFGVGAMSFVDFVNVLTITNSAAVAVLNPQCKRVTLDETAHIGVEVSVMPIPIPLVETAVNKALSQKKEIYHHSWERVVPDIKMCHI